MTKERGHRAIVDKIIHDGKHGPYAVARSEELDGITFGLDQKAWRERDWPEPGMYVVLFEIRRKRAGWRAQRGRFFKPSDEQQSSNSKEHRA